MREEGYRTILCNTDEIPGNEEFYLNVLFDRRVDGIIIAPIQTEEWDFLRQIKEEIPKWVINGNLTPLSILSVNGS